MKYILIEIYNDNEYTTELDATNAEEARKAAEREWDKLTDHDKKLVTQRVCVKLTERNYKYWRTHPWWDANLYELGNEIELKKVKKAKPVKGAKSDLKITKGEKK